MWRGRSGKLEGSGSVDTDGPGMDDADVGYEVGEVAEMADDVGGTENSEDTGTIGDAVVAGSENGNGNSGDRRQAGRNDVPSYAPTDPGWVTDDFSSLDLGEDPNPSSRPVRRLELPPLADATLVDGELSSSELGFDSSEALSVGDQSNDLGVFGVGGNAAQNAGDGSMNDFDVHSAELADGVGSSQLGSPRLSSESSAAPKQGVPPHPLSGGGSDMAGLSDDRNQLRPVSAPPNRVGSDADPFAGFGQSDRGFEDQFSHADAMGPQPRSDRSGRANLELAPTVPVERDKRNWTLPIVGLLALLGLAAGYFFFVRDGSDSTDTFATDETDPASDLVEEDLEPEGASTDSTAGTPAVSELSDNPVLSLSGAVDGPLVTETEYEMTIEGVPEGAEYLVVVDDLPQEPALSYLPVLILPEGRHSLRIDVTAGGKTATTNPVDVYVLAPSLTATHRANLSSVSQVEEGWTEALRQFDEFRAAGHDGIMLSPSDPYPSLLPGFWNLYVPGFANYAEAQAYCEGAGLAIPDACFPAPFDPDGPPRDS